MEIHEEENLAYEFRLISVCVCGHELSFLTDYNRDFG